MSFLGVSSEKLLGFVVTSKGIHLDLEKIRAIQEMQPLWNFKKLRTIGLHLKIHIESYRTLPILHQADEEVWLIYLGQRFPTSIWENQAVPNASTCSGSSSIRKIFPFICKNHGSFPRSLISQNNDQGYEQTIYYLSKTMSELNTDTIQSKRNA